MSVAAAIRDAIRGTRHDYTSGPIGRAIVLLAIPMVMEMAMESLFALVDIFWVSKLGAEAVAAVALTESMLAIVYTVAMGLSIGATAVVARRIGEKNPEGASRAAVQAIVLGVLVALPLAAGGVVLAPRLLSAMGAGEQVLATGVGYPTVMLGGSVTILLLFLINAIFRGAGDAAIAMRVLWFANALNIVLDPCLILGLGPFPELGVTGAAIATNIGRGSGVIFQLLQLWQGRGRVQVGRRHLALEPRVMGQMVRLSASGTFQVLVGTASWIGLVRIISSFGSAALAGYAIGLRIIIFALLPSWGLANAAGTMVGQGLGAGKPDRAERSVWIAGFYNMIFLGLVGVVFVVFSEGLIGLFTRDPAVVPFGVDCLRVISYGFVFYAYGMVLGQSFNGAGDTWTPTFINLFCFWVFEIPLAYALATLGPLIPASVPGAAGGWPTGGALGPRGVFLAIMLAFSLYAVMSAVIFRRGRWKTRKV